MSFFRDFFKPIITIKNYFTKRIYFLIITAYKEEIYIFWLTLFFYFSLFFNFNNKTLVIFFFFYLFVLFILTQDFKKALLFSYLIAWPINVGKTYIIEHISAQQLNISFRPYGIANIIIFSVKEIFIFIMVLLLIKSLFIKKNKVFKLDKISILLILYSFSLLTSSFLGSIRRDISLIYSFYSFKNIIFYFFIRELMKENKKIFWQSLIIFSSSIIFEFILSLFQFIRRTPLGISIEESVEFLPVDISLENVISDFRPVGTFSHANWLANFVLPYLIVFFPFLFFKTKNYREVIFIISFITGFLTMLLSLSRSSWISFFVSLLIFLFLVEKKWGVFLKIKKIFIKFIFFSLPFSLPFFYFFFFPRLINSFYSFEVYGGGYTRWELVKESWRTIKQFPLFGIGLGMSVLYFYQQFQTNLKEEIFSYFPEAVHNGFLSLWQEAGIFSFFLFLFISFLFFKKMVLAIRKKDDIFERIIVLSIMLGLFSLYLNSFFQPFLPGLQEIIFLSIMGENFKKS